MSAPGRVVETGWSRFAAFVRRVWPPTRRRSAEVAALVSPAALEWMRRPDGLMNRRAVGLAYLQQTPRERAVSALARAIDMPAGQMGHDDWLRECVAQDFRAERTVIVRGWILSITEARVAALVSLVS